MPAAATASSVPSPDSVAMVSPTLHRVQVSLAKLPAATLKAHLPEAVTSPAADSKRSGGPDDDAASETKVKKLKLESDSCTAASSHKSSSSSGLQAFKGGGCDEDKALGLEAADKLGSEAAARAEDMKLEIAKIDSILQGNVLGLDKSKRKIR